MATWDKKIFISYRREGASRPTMCGWRQSQVLGRLLGGL
jgi:hypothetical protein